MPESEQTVDMASGVGSCTVTRSRKIVKATNGWGLGVVCITGQEFAIHLGSWIIHWKKRNDSN
jgi:hypothetical protein